MRMMSTDPHPLTTLPGVLVPVHTLRSHPCASVPVNKYPQKDEQAYLTRGFDLDLPLGREKAEEKSREQRLRKDILDGHVVRLCTTVALQWDPQRRGEDL